MRDDRQASNRGIPRIAMAVALLSTTIPSCQAFGPPALTTTRTRRGPADRPLSGGLTFLPSTSHYQDEFHASSNYPTTHSAQRGGRNHQDAPSSSSTSTALYPFFRGDAEAPPQEDADEDATKTRWIRWMMGGKPRGTNKVILREAEALGGVPRSAKYSSADWFHSLITLPNSEILHDIRGPVRAISLWATTWSILHQLLVRSRHHGIWATRLQLPSTAPHSLMMSVLGLLLVFRTNSAYQRFAEGRKIWETIVNSSRDLYRMMMLYEHEIGMDKRRRLQKLLAAFPYLLRHRIRPNLVMRRLDDEAYERDPENTILLYQDQGVKEDDEEAAALAQTEEETGQSRRQTRRPLFWVDQRTLPWRLLPADGALEKCARAQNRPLWVCDRMAQELRTVPDGPSFTNRERLILVSHVDKLSHCIGGAERIHQTVVPLNYARHTLRALTVWLFSLPFVLVKDLQLLTGPVVLVMSWLLFGVFEVSCAIEDPFQGTLRLSILCDTIRRDVLGDEHNRASAFRLEDKKKRQQEREELEQSSSSSNLSNATTPVGGLDSSFA